MTSGVKQYLNAVFAVDCRSLAVFRMLLAVTLLVDLLLRLRVFSMFHTDEGIVPRSAVYAVFQDQWTFSLHYINGGELFQGCMFLLAAVAAVSLFFGCRTRLATVVSWVLLLSLHNANPFIIRGGDELLRLVLFWGMFLPLGARYSLDALHASTEGEGREPDPLFLSPASMGLLMQVLCMFFYSVVQRHGADWFGEGWASYYVFLTYPLTFPLAEYLTRWPDLLRTTTTGVILLELIGPFLLFVPVWQNRLRTILVFAFYGLAVGIGCCLFVGLFPLAIAAAVTPFLPSAFWTWVERRWSRLYDVTREKAQRVCTELPKTVLTNSTERRAQEMRFYRSRRVAVIAMLAMLVTIVWNHSTVTEGWHLRRMSFEEAAEKRVDWLKGLGELVHLDQNWALFPSSRVKRRHWFVIPATMNNGQTIDLRAALTDMRTQAPPDWGVKNPHKPFFSYRIWQYFRRLSRRKYRALRPYLAQYLCREWNRQHPVQEQIRHLELYRVRADYVSPIKANAPSWQLFLSYDCPSGS